jgi:hypothetical protein
MAYGVWCIKTALILAESFRATATMAHCEPRRRFILEKHCCMTGSFPIRIQLHWMRSHLIFGLPVFEIDPSLRFLPLEDSVGVKPRKLASLSSD